MKIQDVINLAKKRGPKTVSVACCQDKEVLLAVENARKEGIIEAILVGDIDKTKEIAEKLNIDLNNKLSFLDVGCGCGPIGIYISKQNKNYTVDMIDVNEKAVNLVKKSLLKNKRI